MSTDDSPPLHFIIESSTLIPTGDAFRKLREFLQDFKERTETSDAGGQDPNNAALKIAQLKKLVQGGRKKGWYIGVCGPAGLSFAVLYYKLPIDFDSSSQQ
ncbi:uncharacterized protein EI90DRAFT_3125141 [Cantharellus anzutake]|uniref:uncharacterized protein n=1 Tax=Cantharellus anzutake TaxID=1750568 RepID=UPI001907C890|nr:uncharacterized protein EI90DRAFT_3125141 [Cantharellus anzutake]KAF8329350.1 hypothetical protein EI90DRAFT_3125141 [Cantharellus anzutake]